MSAETITLRTVATHAGVSIKTVSRVLNNEPFVSALTREKVQDAIAKLEFSPNIAARQLRGQRSYSLAVVYEPPASEFLTGILEGILPVCRDASYKLLLEPLAATETRMRINTMIERRDVDGFIFLPPLSEDIALVQSVLDAGLHAILVASTIDLTAANLGVSKIGIDDFAAGQEMGRHLIAQGHKRIGYIRLREQHSMANQRGHGLRAALEEAGLPENNLSVAQGESSFDSGFAAAAKLLDDKNPPSAIFAGNDYMAAGVIAYAREHGLSVPDDLSVVGFDGADLSKMFVPPFTTIKQPLKQYGDWAARKLLATINNPEVEKAEDILDFELIQRHSVKNIKRSNSL